MIRPIVFFTDFGSHDIYVGQLHAVALGSNSHYSLIDLFHDVNPFDILGGASLLAAMLDYLPHDAIVVGVVDPGVGGRRLPIAVELGGRWLVGPDNGLFSRSVAWANSAPGYWILEVPPDTAKTFQGRDVFLPAAIQLAAGELGSMHHRVDDPNDLSTHRNAVGLVGLESDDQRVIHVDHYGNLISGIRGTEMKSSQTVAIAGQVISHANYYEVAPPSKCFWHVNSIGLLEISANQVSAASTLGVEGGAKIAV